MKVDLTLDFEALLLEAKVQWKLREDALEPISKAKYSHILCGGNMGTETYRKLEDEEDAIRSKYDAWIKENLTDRGIMLKTMNFDCKPVGLWIVVAGPEF